MICFVTAFTAGKRSFTCVLDYVTFQITGPFTFEAARITTKRLLFTVNRQNVPFEITSSRTLVGALVAFEWLLPAVSKDVLFDFP